MLGGALVLMVLGGALFKSGPAASIADEIPVEVAQDASVTVAAAGDIACGADSTNASCRAMDTSDLLLALNPDAVLALGDLQYEKGAYADFLAGWATSWGRL